MAKSKAAAKNLGKNLSKKPNKSSIKTSQANSELKTKKLASDADEPRLVSESQVIMTELVLPSHTNALGSVFGGTVVSWIDICAAIAAQRHSRMPVVTASIDALQFVAPVYKGWTVNLKASVNFTGRTSMEIGVRVDAENPMTGETFHTATAYLTFVALGKDQKPVPVPPIRPKTREEKRRYQQAEERRKLRLELRERFANDSRGKRSV